MNNLLNSIQKNNNKNKCVPAFRKDAIGDAVVYETLWGGSIRILNPARLTTAWLAGEDPMMSIAGAGYKASEVRDQTFALQQEASTSLKGNRKLPKAKVAEALSAVKPTEEQTKVVAAVLYHLRKIQTICFHEETKTIWTMPEDLRIWSTSLRTLWVDHTCERMIDITTPIAQWLSDREQEGWTISWPVADGTMESVKAELADSFPHISVHALEPGKKVKKEDYCRVLGKAQAIRHITNE